MMAEQMGAEELRVLYARGRYDEIVAAKDAGQLDRMLGVPETDIALIDRAKSQTLDRADIERLWAMGRHDLIDQARADERIGERPN